MPRSRLIPNNLFFTAYALIDHSSVERALVKKCPKGLVNTII